MARITAAKNSIGIYISPKEICLAQTRLGGDGRMQVEHLVNVPTGFHAKEGTLRPLSLNNDFFDEKASWINGFQTAVRKISWNTSTVVVTLSSQFSILRYFVMPAVERRFWSKAIPIESKKYIPVSFDEVVYDFNAVPLAEGGKLGVLFGLTQRKSVEFVMNILKASGLEMAAVEVNSYSVERLFAFLDPGEHAAKAYIHFSGGTSLMLFSSAGSPVLYRETDYSISSTMSERKRLDVKGAMQFVDRYIGGQVYKRLMLSGDGLEIWKPVAEQESTMPVETWEPAGAAALKDNDAASFFAVGASLRGRIQEKMTLDISGVSTAAGLEKQVHGYVWGVALALGGLLLFLSLVGQIRLMMINSEFTALSSAVGGAPELEGNDVATITAKIEKLQTDVKMLSVLDGEADFLAPKLNAIADNIPPELWLMNIHYLNQLAASEVQAAPKILDLTGETNLKGEMKLAMVEVFKKALKNSPEFKVFMPPGGGMEFDLTGDSSGQAADSADGQSRASRSTVFTIKCAARRRS